MSLPYPADDSHILEFYLVVKSAQAILKHIRSRHQIGVAPIGKYTWFPTYDRKWRVKYWKSATTHLTDPTLKVAFSEFQPYFELLDHLDREVRKQKAKDALDPLIIESLEQVGVAINQMLETLGKQLSEEAQRILQGKLHIEPDTFGDQRAKDLIDMAPLQEPCLAWFCLRTALQFGTKGIQASKAFLELSWRCRMYTRNTPQALKFRMKSIECYKP